jgi:hypothetical protein
MELHWYWEELSKSDQDQTGIAFRFRAHCYRDEYQQEPFRSAGSDIRVMDLSLIKDLEAFKQWKAEEALRMLITDAYRIQNGIEV